MTPKEKIEQLLMLANELMQEKLAIDTKFKTILAVILRKDYFKLAAISDLSKTEANGDAILDLSRSIFEDMINMEYMLVKGKEESAELFEGYDAIEEKIDKDFLEANGSHYQTEQAELIDKNFEAKKSNYERQYKDGHTELFRNWAGKDIDAMINTIVKANVITPSEKEVLLQAYIQGNRQNHLSPSAVKFYLNQQAIDTRQKSSYEIGLGLAILSFGRVASQFAHELGKAEINENIVKVLK